MSKTAAYYYMTDEEIAREYRQAKNKIAQVRILADLNAVDVSAMQDKLIEMGLLRARAQKKPRTMAAQTRKNIPNLKIESERALQLYRDGKSDREIANEFGVTRQRIGQWRKQMGLPFNTSGTAARM